ncbi:hypothetical protein [Paenibacillus sp. S150]|uniref:hypothetical protein n=1 Tax=Paenibacillus sp. S150 TaxID=2749826 RepID=UPI001C598BBC|nr:hypothetical protein [Paenibacillus sp. S150]MBW4082407.1 hypothetical protein [Paenibacillus sp. S150]
MRERKFTNGLVTFSLIDEEALPELAGSLVQFLDPYFKETENRDSNFKIHFKPYSLLPGEWLKHTAEQIVIRHSTAAAFNLKGRKFIWRDGSTVVIDETYCTGYHFNQDSETVVLYGSEQSHIHLYEFVRYTSLLIEERAGSMLLHASGAIKDGACYLVLGHKGAGKTSTLLNLIDHNGCQYFSGDKVLISQGKSGLRIRGWPDYPHVGIGTLKNYPAWVSELRLDLQDENGEPKPDSDKLLISPSLFRKVVLGAAEPETDKIGALIFPEITAEDTSITDFGRTADRTGILRAMIEYPHEFLTVKWHPLAGGSRLSERLDYTDLLEALAETRWISVKGKTCIPRDTLRQHI